MCKAAGKELHGFDLAQPVWITNMQFEMNVLAGFRAMIHLVDRQRTVFRITASSVYRFYIGGKFIGHGPAAAPHGYYRVDVWDITEALRDGKNIIAVEVAGYNVNSYYTLDQPSFVQAEVVCGSSVLAATGTGANSFEAGILPERLQKVQRYSFQRPFVEIYRMTPGYTAWRSDENGFFKAMPPERVSEKKLLPRRVKLPEFKICKPQVQVSEGTVQIKKQCADVWKNRSLTNIGPQLKGFKEDELEVRLSEDAQKIETRTRNMLGQSYETDSRVHLDQRTYRIVDFGTNLSGFIGCEIVCEKNTKIYFIFDEMLSGQTIDFKRNAAVNIVRCEMAEGEYAFESLEPYTLKYLQIVVLEGQCRIDTIYLREYVNPDVARAEFTCSDDRLNLIFNSGVNTFKQNVVDVFMDCPSRERAGWLCDSFFTSRVAGDLSGNTMVETNFYENYLLPDSYPCIPDGMLPMCYPADHYDGVYIPQWALWFIIQLKEYADRTEDCSLIEQLKGKVYRLLAFLEKYKNEYGLLEKLEGWQFIEWSKANAFVNDVNYPTNMLYAAALEAAGSIYKDSRLTAQAGEIKDTIMGQSYNGEFFRDNAVRTDGKLAVQENYTEICQYYAFFFHTAAAQTHEKLLNTLFQKLGPSRKIQNDYPQVFPANAFIGNYLRMELLSLHRHNRAIIKELCAYFLGMAMKTGTLWEHDSEEASLNHGFASHVVHIIYRDILGIYKINARTKEVVFRFYDIDLTECTGRVPVPEGEVMLLWKRDKKEIMYACSVPQGYKTSIENLSGKTLQRIYKN